MVKFREYYFADMAVSVVTWIRMAAKLWVNFFHTYSDIFFSFLEIFVEKIKQSIIHFLAIRDATTAN